MQLKSLKFYLVTAILILVVATGLVWSTKLQAQSSDAIAIRIVPNPDHFSVYRWYASKGLIGAPQALTIDGYQAIRDGYTVYINMANIKKADISPYEESLSTEIMIISYTQSVDTVTSDIFGQMVKNLKFNTNISDSGFCSISTDSVCSYSGDCPLGEYCTSLKAKVTRDVKRLEDLADLKIKIDTYRQINNHYPKLDVGTYVSGFSLSVWPSWQQTFTEVIGSSLPVDPINKIGACTGYNSTTCWDENKLEFSQDISKYILPPGSHVYLYASLNQGAAVRYCVQMESRYSNIQGFNCSDGSQANSAPTISAVNLSGIPGQEFNGYVSLFDANNDPLKLTIDLVSPASDQWLSKRWQWGSGLNKFSVLGTSLPNQKQIYAQMAGIYNSDPEFYTVRLTVDDGQGAANSVFSKNYPVSLSPMPASLDNISKTGTIGSPDSVTMNGLDVNGDSFTQVMFQKATFNGVALTQSALNLKGFSLSGMNLSQTFKATQLTGTYVVDVYALSPGSAKQTSASFTYKLVNNPPTFQRLVANFSNNTNQVCNYPDKCSVSIDNGEKATISFNGTDPDGHSLSYSLVNTDSALSITSAGLISGLEKLNVKATSTKTYPISVKIVDAFCSNSSPEECSSTYTFDLIVNAYCSLGEPSTVKVLTLPGPFTVNKSGEALNTGVNLSCSTIGTSTANVKFMGISEDYSHNQAIVVVSDTSFSMGANIVINGESKTAITRLREALAGPNGFTEKMRVFASSSVRLKNDLSTKIGIVAYNTGVIDSLTLNVANILDDLAFKYLNYNIGMYSNIGATNTFSALNKASDMLKTIPITGVDKIVLLLSDGRPTIVQNTFKCKCEKQSPMTCNCADPYNLNNLHEYAPFSDPKYYPPKVYDTNGCLKKDSKACYNNEGCIKISSDILNCELEDPEKASFQHCGRCVCLLGDWPDCEKIPCECGTNKFPHCDTCPPRTGKNSFNLKTISELFNIQPVHAGLAPTQCVSDAPCPACSPGYSSMIDYSLPHAIVENCDTTYDVNWLTNDMKLMQGISIYTVYYKTTSTKLVDDPAKRMCDWSSNNGKNCENKEYAFAGDNISDMIDQVIASFRISKPKNVFINTTNIPDTNASAQYSEAVTPIDNLSCGWINPIVKFDNKGSLEFSNLKINYCPIKLHP